jgi:hypothetical protein
MSQPKEGNVLDLMERTLGSDRTLLYQHVFESYLDKFNFEKLKIVTLLEVFQEFEKNLQHKLVFSDIYNKFTVKFDYEGKDGVQQLIFKKHLLLKKNGNL